MSRSANRPLAEQSGATLVEMLVALAVLALVAMVLASGIGSPHSTQLNCGRTSLLARAQAVHLSAISSGTPALLDVALSASQRSVLQAAFDWILPSDAGSGADRLLIALPSGYGRYLPDLGYPKAKECAQ